MKAPMTLKLAWRNVWRNPRRTLITASAIGLGFFMVFILIGFTEGTQRRLEATVTDAWLASGQVHLKGYREAPDVDLLIPDLAATLKVIRATPGVEAASPRVLASGMISMGARSSAVALIGVDFSAERAVTRWGESFSGGDWPQGDGGVMIGEALAARMELEVGGPLNVSMADLKTGEATSIKLKISGLLVTGDPLLDRSAAILSRAALSQGLGIKDAAHQIALRAAPSTFSALKIEGLDVADWRALSPMLEKMSELQAFSMLITLGVVLFILGLGILNTLTMALVERFKEFGILKAIGTTPARLGGLILAEASVLSLVGVTLGLALALPVHWLLSTKGLPMPGTEYGGVIIHRPIYTIITPAPVLYLALGVTLLTLIVAGIIAARAALIRPVEALRHG
ncbi:ABC transporter permease [Myxococcota bacterium]|nr:ABC transporter permease [Myxococcota bacterium]MBU1432790.1 ABC transporter permease [Myxococcota bacterium]MBU1897305.1 ABC transporter permease [Myxococcota bacterium]